MKFIIRKATVEDLDTLVEIEEECFTSEAFTKKQLEYCLKSSDFVSLVALVDEKIVGFIIGAVEILGCETAGHVYTLDIKKEYRKKGSGGKLLDAFESILSEKGIRTVYLEVRLDNIPARRLYSKHGYKFIKVLRNYYEPRVDAVMLRKILRT
ncbi:MAG: ribosomal protein S18-alanine N-acetyltransferase [Candidatus Bathyarchaeia archaeon]|nr:ribosomal protein S18-alanine N-acetyltransferase [Candidatus Bathyarchaeota archaeon]